MTERTAQWQTAEQWVGDSVRYGGVTSGDLYYAWLRDTDQYVTRDVARDVWRAWGTATRYADVIERYPPSQGVPRAWYAETESEYISRYGYKVEVTYHDEITGETLTAPYFTPSDVQLSRNELEDVISSEVETGTGDVRGTVESMTVLAYYHRTGAAW